MQEQTTGTNSPSLNKSFQISVDLHTTRHKKPKQNHTHKKIPLVQDAPDVLSEYRHRWKRLFVFQYRLVLNNIFNISSLDGGDLHKFLINESFILKSPLLSLFKTH